MQKDIDFSKDVILPEDFFIDFFFRMEPNPEKSPTDQANWLLQDMAKKCKESVARDLLNKSKKNEEEEEEVEEVEAEERKSEEEKLDIEKYIDLPESNNRQTAKENQPTLDHKTTVEIEKEEAELFEDTESHEKESVSDPKITQQ